MSAKEIILLRHGSTGLDGRYVGSTDVSITDDAKARLTKTLGELRATRPEVVLCSPMLRCRQTLETLHLQTKTDYVDDLKEIDFGSWELKNFCEIQKKDSNIVAQWLESPSSFCFPEGECFPTFISRIELVYNKLLELQKSSVLIVSHGGVIRFLLCYLLGLSKDNYGAFEIQPGTYSRVILRDTIGSLQAFNCIN